MFSDRSLKKRLLDGESVVGTWVTIPSTIALDIACATGLDFVILDSEHGPLGFETLQNLIIVAESRRVTPIVRVSGLHENEILKALDIGAHGVQVPNIDSVDQCRALVEFAKYPPIGKRGFSPFTRAGGYGGRERTSLTRISNDETLVAINVEGKDAIDNIDEILSIDEVDVVFIGLFDLSKALGVPGEIESHLVQEAMGRIISKIQDKGKIPGTIATSEQSMKKYLAMGVQYLVYLVDAEIIRNSYSNIVSIFNSEKKNG